MANLFDINRELQDLWEAALDPETGELDEEKLAAFEALGMERDAKIENIACWIKNLKSDAEALKTEAKNMTDRAKAAERKGGQPEALPRSSSPRREVPERTRSH